jgi:hypothetical protein
MYYRVAIQRELDQLDQPPSWQWKSGVLSSLQALLQFLRLYGTLPQDQLRIFSSSSRENLEEQLAQENNGLNSQSVTASQFLQERNLAVRERAQAAKPGATVATSKYLREDITLTGAPENNYLSLSDKKRLELEFGPSGNHDVSYSFALPASMPQVLAWMKLLAKVHRGELQP